MQNREVNQDLTIVLSPEEIIFFVLAVNRESLCLYLTLVQMHDCRWGQLMRERA